MNKDSLMKGSGCKCLLAGALRMSKSAAKLASLQPVTAFKTFVPCVELKISARVANETKFGPGAKHEGNEIGCRRSVDHSCKYSAGGALRGALPPCASCGVKRRQDRVDRPDAQCLCQRSTLCLDRELKVGLDIRFSLRMPANVLGTPHDVLVHCTGRVVRCSLSHHQYLAASTIDEYRFAEQ